ncbi:TRAF family member-associated NF-kappa-B activator-like [Lissotriton helveticus]
MEEAFFQLSQEFRQLQAVCARQAELLQRLTTKKSWTADMPVSMPVQRTDDQVREQAEDHGSESKVEGMPCGPLDWTASKSPHPSFSGKKPCKADSSLLLPKENYCFMKQGAIEERSQMDASKKNISTHDGAHGEHQCDLLRRYGTQCPGTDSINERNDSIPTVQVLPYLELTDHNWFNSFPELYNLLHYMQSEVVLGQDSLLSDAKLPMHVRGPEQTSWNPRCVSEDCSLAPGNSLSSDSPGLSSQTCDFCQAVFPAGAATNGEYLRHLTAHIE